MLSYQITVYLYSASTKLFRGTCCEHVCDL